MSDDDWENMSDGDIEFNEPTQPADTEKQEPPLQEEEKDWNVSIPVVVEKDVAKKPIKDDAPMLLIDLTHISKGALHSKFDKNSNNDPALASKLRKEAELKYESYKNDSRLIAERVIIPCGSSVWKDAIAQLRDDVPGHYFIPLFNPVG